VVTFLLKNGKMKLSGESIFGEYAKKIEVKSRCWKHLHLEILQEFVVFHIPHRIRTWKCCFCFLLGEGTKNRVPGVKPQIQPSYGVTSGNQTWAGGRKMRYPHLPHPLFATADTIRGMDT